MFPPAQRDQMVNTLVTAISAQMRKGFGMDSISDPGLKALFADYEGKAHQTEVAVLEKDLPSVFEADAVAYTHEFSLAELKEIHAFGETPTGGHYLARCTSLLTDPAVAQANSAMVADTQAALAPTLSDFKEKLTDYFKAHPDAAKEVADKSPEN